MNFALFSPASPQTLLSLGQLHSCGGSYQTRSTPNRIEISTDPATILDITPLLDNSNLYTANLPFILATMHKNPHLQHPPNFPPPTTLFTPSLRKFIQHHPPQSNSLTTAKLKAFQSNIIQHPKSAVPLFPDTKKPLQSLTLLPKSAYQKRITSEQYARILASNDLHYTQSHPPDTQLCYELSHGKHPYSNLTSSDIILMRKILGTCPHCPNVKPAAIRLPSTTPPATHPGDKISFDPQKLPCPVLGGFNHVITMVDEHTGHIDQPGTASKTNAAVTKGIQKIIHVTYNANGHRVNTLHGDAERINTSLAPFLGSIGTQLKVSYPGHHAHRAERTTQTIDQRARSVVSHLPYILPPETTLLLKQSVGETLNNSVCKASAPLTRNEALNGFKIRRAPIGFGRCAMVTQPLDKRVTISRDSGTPLKQISNVELGVSMGLIPGTDKTQWLLSNGLVVPRIPIGPLLPHNFTPFNWKAKKDHTTIQLPSATPPDLTTSVQIPQDPNISLQPKSDYIHEPLLPEPDTSYSLTLPTPISTAPPPEPIPAIHNAEPLNAPDLYQLQQELPTISTPSPIISPSDPSTIVSHSDPPLIPPNSPATTTRHNLQLHPPHPTHHHNTRQSKRVHFSEETPTPRSGYGGWGNLSTITCSGHKFRKLHNLRQASIRDRIHLQNNPPPDFLNNRSTEIRPNPPIRQQNEWPLHKALLVLDPTKVNAAVDKENKKVFETYKSLKVIKPNQVEHNAAFVPLKLIIREKTNKDITARFALGGDRQPPHTYGDTHAGTSDATHRAFTLAAGQAHAAIHKLELITFNFDIPAAFLNRNPLPRDKTGNTQLFTRTPSYLPPPYNSKTCEVIGAHYGLKQSNHLYDQDFINLMTSNGFTPCPSHPYTFQKWSIPTLHAPPSHHLFVSMHVDDGDSNTTCPQMYKDFQKLITDRYGDLPFHSPSQGTCGQTQVLNADKSITLHYGPYLRKMLTRIGMDLVPPALSPDIKGLFEPSQDPTPLTLTETAEFRTINGELIHVLPQRHEVRKVITHLLTKGESPDKGDYLKQLHLLRYIKSCPDIGPTFSADPTNYPNGVEIHSASDCAHNVHPDGQSHGAYQITIGKPGATTSPFCTYSAKEKGVSLHPHEGEYVILSRTAKQLIHWRQFAEDLGFPQKNPSVMLTDNSTSINLTKAPLIPAKSRHIALKHHHIRWAYKSNQIIPQHQGTNDIIPDAATKHVGPSRFLYFRKQLFHPPPSE